MQTHRREDGGSSTPTTPNTQRRLARYNLLLRLFFFFFALRRPKPKKNKKRLPDFFFQHPFFFSRAFLGARVLFGCWLRRLKGPQCSPSPYHVTFDLFGQRDQQTLEGEESQEGSQSHRRKDRAQFHCSGCKAECEHVTGIQRTFVRLG